MLLWLDSDAEYSDNAKYTEQLIDSQTAEDQTIIFSVDVKYDAQCSFKYSYDEKTCHRKIIQRQTRQMGWCKIGYFRMNQYADSDGFRF